jgi:3-phenylpropionate/cinnamic acid dioxygenase small subunit
MSVGVQDQLIEIQQLLALEGMLLDERRYDEWLDLFTQDTSYVMPVPVNRTRTSRPSGRQLNLLEETMSTLRLRTTRAVMDTAWSEHPQSRTVHLVTNVLIREVISNDKLAVRSAFLIYRHRLATEVEMFAGYRDDVVRRGADGRWRIHRRVIHLAANTMPGKNLSVFF